jgi:hypothetical protein
MDGLLCNPSWILFESVFRILVSVRHTASPTTGRLMAIIRRLVASAILFLVEITAEIGAPISESARAGYFLRTSPNRSSALLAAPTGKRRDAENAENQSYRRGELHEPLTYRML